MDAVDIELELEVSGRDGAYHVQARSTLGGESESDTEFGFESMDVEQRLYRLRMALLRAAAITRRVPTREEQPVQRLGSELFERLFVGDVRVLFDLTRQQAEHQDVPMRLVLRIRAPELAVLPWEFLYDARRDDYLSLSMLLVRYPEILEPVRPLRVSGPLRILGMIARAPDHEALDVAGERAHLHRALDPLIAAGRVELVWVRGETWRDLQRALDARSWHAVHFIGHGGFDPVAGEGVFHLPGESGENYLLRASHLARLLGPHQSLRLVMLNSCDSAAGNVSDLFSSAAAALVRRGIPAVLAMQFEISDSAAVEFTRSFYGAVAVGRPVDTAVRDARLGVCLSRPNSLEWGTPVLFLRQRDGRIFDITTPLQARPTVQNPAGAERPRVDQRRMTQNPGPRVPPRPVWPATPATPVRRWWSRGRMAAARMIAVAAGVFGVAGLLTWQLLSGTTSATNLTVAATTSWKGTGVQVQRGQQLTISATGKVTLAQGIDSEPDGSGLRSPGHRPVLADAGVGALIGRIGTGTPFTVGRSVRLTAPAKGELWLRVNELDVSDNTGEYRVLVQLD